MKILATLALLAVLTLPAGAAVIHDESVNGDLSSDPANPTLLGFPSIDNTVIGTVANTGSPADPRDYITFTIANDRVLSALYLEAYAPDNLTFASFNAGSSSVIPSAATSSFLLSGIHVSLAQLGTNLMPAFVSNSVTTNALAQPQLGPGDYCFLIQQTSAITTTYQLRFVVDFVLPTRSSSWGVIKNLYR